MSDILWKAPPNRAKRGRRPSQALDDIALKLQKRPGKWALVVQGAKSPNGTSSWKRRGCQATSSRNDDGTYDIYARYPETS